MRRGHLTSLKPHSTERNSTPQFPALKTQLPTSSIRPESINSNRAKIYGSRARCPMPKRNSRAYTCKTARIPPGSTLAPVAYFQASKCYAPPPSPAAQMLTPRPFISQGSPSRPILHNAPRLGMCADRHKAELRAFC
ncbi:hypothetical protein ONS95_014167 [Cadophora gregata]|uniref:uncharacterized protein n=1 Tax=Cadophora gregata TaxID=51156 RepID=UPI0026DD02EF|nr:uncharacterized protein ONS95_014167 [Cadophora gregata]KAK0114682.1 hypothetical protein ONS95_014167 [Cadophora gregata]